MYNNNSGTSGHNIQPELSSHAHVEEEKESEEVNVNTVTMPINASSPKKKIALLATALVIVRHEGHTSVLRALIDPGSQGCFITERAAQLLKAKRYPVKGSIVGVGSTTMNIKQVVQVEVLSRHEIFSLKVRAYVLKGQLTALIPSKTIEAPNWNHIEGLTLADAEFHKPGHIDMLLGVDEYAQMIKDNVIKGPPGAPCAQSTSLGWILFGGIQDVQEEDQPKLVLHQTVDIEELLKTFWEVETDAIRNLTKDEEKCEKIYKETHERDKEGRYIVKLPFKSEETLSQKGNTRDTALKRLNQLNRKFCKSPELKKAYTEVIEEYITMGHMKLIPKNEIKNDSVYLPHHAVVRQDKETTKTRVVFDASNKGFNGISLNDELLTGPILQEDLRSIIMRWRMHKICFSSDIQMMYRMIRHFKEDTDFHRVLWRDDTSNYDEVKEYRLQTVTFGTASAPYLAIKTLKQLAEDEGQDFPGAAKTIMEDFYVDDLLSGRDTVIEAIKAKDQITEILRGKFALKKWSSNNAEFLRSVNPQDRTSKASLDINLDGIVKALGVSWNLKHDEFEYNYTLPPVSKIITKRNILADLQKLFDPLGWIAPVIVKAKILIKNLWLTGKAWDEKIPNDVELEWIHLRNDFNNVKDIKIQRWMNTLSTEINNVTIHGFCDASMNAMAAVVYCRVVQPDGTVTIQIVAAKTKVAPVKTISLPRLELCGALLLSKLLRNVHKAMRIPANNIYAWTDSSVVLAWLSGSPNRWKPFVANRVVEILDNVSGSQWHHVVSENNSADVASRGCTVTELRQNHLWWKGPLWLSKKEITFTKLHEVTTDLEKRVKTTVLLNIMNQEDKRVLQFENYDNLKELQNTIIYCKRFMNLHKNKINGPITTEELKEALNICIKEAQNIEFEDDIENIKKYKHVKQNSRLKCLNPYLDENNIIRVGGRLRNANISNNGKHPIIMSNKGPLTLLIVADAHQKTMHGGIQMMLSYIRNTFWIIKAKNVVKSVLNKCLVCAKLRARAKSQIMGDLPDVRVTPARPFLHSGVDFAGPYDILMSKGRGMKTTKAYIAIFICMAVKAIHLELVSDLTSEAFIAAFKRFVSRRGRCSDLWSDQGRNFVAANKELTQEWEKAKLQFRGHIENCLAQDGTQWHFIPPYSPNFGGLWEAGVKAMKHHIKRTITKNLTFEEFTTVLCQVEACLNSRPLSPIDESDVDNLNPLTPAHFLIGESTITVPAPDTSNVNINNLARWQYTQKMLTEFWRKWQQEYLSRLQQRPKWLKTKPEFQIGDIVLVKQDGLAPGKWLMGRVTDKHPGSDGITRVYSVKSGSNVTKRCISKLCYLPVEQN